MNATETRGAMAGLALNWCIKRWQARNTSSPLRPAVKPHGERGVIGRSLDPASATVAAARLLQSEPRAVNSRGPLLRLE